MCVEAMDTRSKHIKPNCLRKTMKPGSKLRWKLLRVSQEEENDEGLNQSRVSAVRTTIKKYLRREQRRAQLVKLAKVLGDIGKKEKKAPVFGESPTAAYMQRQPAGAMAPANTTQYLMGNVYEDMTTNKIQTVPVSHESSAQLYNKCLSPESVYAAMDADFESCLAFQQRDFEDVFDQCW